VQQIKDRGVKLKAIFTIHYLVVCQNYLDVSPLFFHSSTLVLLTRIRPISLLAIDLFHYFSIRKKLPLYPCKWNFDMLSAENENYCVFRLMTSMDRYCRIEIVLLLLRVCVRRIMKYSITQYNQRTMLVVLCN
jgi:hypothetical protein